MAISATPQVNISSAPNKRYTTQHSHPLDACETEGSCWSCGQGQGTGTAGPGAGAAAGGRYW